MTVSRVELERQVAQRAGDRCEYCRMHQNLQGARFHLEHILPSSRGGASALENLAWACPGCNLRKSDRIDAVDPETNATVLLFHPRTETWGVHFVFDDYQVVGLTPVGRATTLTLDFNQARRIQIRQAEQLFGLFPPVS